MENLSALANLCPKFDINGVDVYDRWMKWLKSFELTMDATNIDDEQKVKWLLILAGTDVQQISDYAEDPEGSKFVLSEYTWTVKKLTKHFASKATSVS